MLTEMQDARICVPVWCVDGHVTIHCRPTHYVAWHQSIPDMRDIDVD